MTTNPCTSISSATESASGSPKHSDHIEDKYSTVAGKEPRSAEAGDRLLSPRGR